MDTVKGGVVNHTPCFSPEVRLCGSSELSLENEVLKPFFLVLLLLLLLFVCLSLFGGVHFQCVQRDFLVWTSVSIFQGIVRRSRLVQPDWAL